MGDGQHGWAAAEWVMMLRNMFVREEPDSLILGSGLFPEWLQAREDLSFGPTPTPWGPVSLRLVKRGTDLLLGVDAEWRVNPPVMEARVPGCRPMTITTSRGELLPLISENL
jgi:hypothetical protein